MEYREKRSETVRQLNSFFVHSKYEIKTVKIN